MLSWRRVRRPDRAVDAKLTYWSLLSDDDEVDLHFSLPCSRVLFAAACGGDWTAPATSRRTRSRSSTASEIPRTEFDDLIDAGEDELQGPEARLPEGRDARSTRRFKNQAVAVPRPAGQFEQAGRGAGHRGHRQGDGGSPRRRSRSSTSAATRRSYEEQLKEQGLTDEQVREDIRGAARLGEDLRQGDQGREGDRRGGRRTYYEKNKAQYGQPESREVRHILVKTKAVADSVRRPAEAGRRELRRAREEVLAGPGLEGTGGKLTITAGQTVAAVRPDRVRAEEERRSRAPVKTEYGYHIIQALADVKPAKTTPLEGACKDADPAAARCRRRRTKR